MRCGVFESNQTCEHSRDPLKYIIKCVTPDGSGSQQMCNLCAITWNACILCMLYSDSNRMWRIYAVRQHHLCVCECVYNWYCACLICAHVSAQISEQLGATLRRHIRWHRNVGKMTQRWRHPDDAGPYIACQARHRWAYRHPLGCGTSHLCRELKMIYPHTHVHVLRCSALQMSADRIVPPTHAMRLNVDYSRVFGANATTKSQILQIPRKALNPCGFPHSSGCGCLASVLLRSERCIVRKFSMKLITRTAHAAQMFVQTFAFAFRRTAL